MEIKNKVEFETVLKTLVLKEVSEKTLAKQKDVVAYIDSQITQYGAEKHLAFLKRVFHNQKVSAIQFFKTLKNVKANTESKKNEKKAEPKEKNSKAKAKTAKVATKAEPKAQSNKTESKKNDTKKQASGERSSLKDYERLENEVAKLVDTFNQQWSNDIEVEVVMSYEYRVKKTTTIR